MLFLIFSFSCFSSRASRALQRLVGFLCTMMSDDPIQPLTVDLWRTTIIWRSSSPCSASLRWYFVHSSFYQLYAGRLYTPNTMQDATVGCKFVTFKVFGFKNYSTSSECRFGQINKYFTTKACSLHYSDSIKCKHQLKKTLFEHYSFPWYLGSALNS